MANKRLFIVEYPKLADEVDYLLTDAKAIKGAGLANRTLDVWWKCSRFDHSYPRSIESTIVSYRKKMKTRCLYCLNELVLPGFNDLATTHPLIAAQWDYEKNPGVTPSQVFASDTDTVYWLCESGHSTSTHPRARAIDKKKCGVCLNKAVEVGSNDVFTTHPELREIWDFKRNQHLDPETLMASSDKKAHWICAKGHQTESAISAKALKGTKCSACGNRQVEPGFNDLATHYPDLAKEFEVDANKMTPDQVLAGTGSYYFWRCQRGHTWKAKVSNRVSRDSGCPGCTPGGFDSSKPGTFYFIEHSDMRAMKIGITNPSSKIDRVEAWKSAGWKLLYRIDSPDGVVVQSLEVHIKRWLRVELGLKPFLGKSEVGFMRGASETFDGQAVEASKVIEKVNETYQTINNGG